MPVEIKVLQEQANAFMEFLKRKYPHLLEPIESIEEKKILNNKENYNTLSLEQSTPHADVISPLLISPHILKLNLDVLKQAQAIVKTLFKISHQENYSNYYKNQITAKSLPLNKNYGIMMSYDFHLDQENKLKLIEVNTNAAFLLLGRELYHFRNLPSSPKEFDLIDLKDCLINEVSRAHHKYLRRISIVDNKPSQQRLYIEFLLAQALFNSWGITTEILDSASPKVLESDLVYFRDTDFYCERQELQSLKSRWLSDQVVISPNPTEYFLLADKERMTDWGNPIWQEQVQIADFDKLILLNHVPKSTLLTQENKLELWTKRKNLFFKPTQSFGSKQSFKGSSISRKVFDDFKENEILAQEYIPAPEFKAPDGEEFKFDLRFYAYQDHIQMALGRLYQGQVTNSKTLGGGFACIQFE